MPDPSLAARDASLRERCAVLAHEFTWAHLTPYMRERAFVVLLAEARALRLADDALPRAIHEEHMEGRL